MKSFVGFYTIWCMIGALYSLREKCPCTTTIIDYWLCDYFETFFFTQIMSFSVIGNCKLSMISLSIWPWTYARSMHVCTIHWNGQVMCNQVFCLHVLSFWRAIWTMVIFLFYEHHIFNSMFICMHTLFSPWFLALAWNGLCFSAFMDNLVHVFASLQLNSFFRMKQQAYFTMASSY